ncbi:MAG: prolipoprotein diacylglyceryl transferase [Euzebya sp.]
MIASIPVPPFSGIDFGFTEVRIYGVLIATAVLVAASWTRKRYQSFGGDGELADRVTIWAVVLAFVGARGAYVLPRLGRFTDDPLGVFQVWEGGLALFGGLTVGLVVLVVLMRRWGGDFPAFMDGLAPALPLAQAIGRLGNYFNQELYGTPTDLPWGVVIENPIRGEAPLTTFHPTFLYESLANLVLMGVILRLQRTDRMKKGTLILVYAIGYGVIRFLLELIRTDTTFRVLGLSRNAIVAAVFVVVGLALLRQRQRRADLPVVGTAAVELHDSTAEEDTDQDEPGEASAVFVGITEADQDHGGDGDQGSDAKRDPNEGGEAVTD